MICFLLYAKYLQHIRINTSINRIKYTVTLSDTIAALYKIDKLYVLMGIAVKAILLQFFHMELINFALY